MLYWIEPGTVGESARETSGDALATERDPVEREIQVGMLPVVVMAIVAELTVVPKLMIGLAVLAAVVLVLLPFLLLGDISVALWLCRRTVLKFPATFKLFW